MLQSYMNLSKHILNGTFDICVFYCMLTLPYKEKKKNFKVNIELLKIICMLKHLRGVY